jgi:UV DNA damage endonuclease
MRVGYASVNLSIGCTSAKTFRLASYSKERLYETIGNNLLCLLNTLHYNVERGIRFFRLPSELVPFASHEVCQEPWQTDFASQFRRIGRYIRENDLRVALHPGQFTVINSPSEKIFENSLAELVYQTEMLDLMSLDSTHKIQIHVGGVYEDKIGSMLRFTRRYLMLPPEVRRRLVIENDDRLYTVRDCWEIHDAVGVPIVFDNLHHHLNNVGEPLTEAFDAAYSTWGGQDGLPMVDYSSQAEGKRLGNHADTVDLDDFFNFLVDVRRYDFDVMLEIKDKETSVLKVLEFLQHRHSTLPPERTGEGFRL